jgi:hypothetical protein
MRVILTALALAVSAAAAIGGANCHDESETTDPSAVEKHATRAVAVAGLKPLSVLVGEWRGVGQPKRGSRNGAWIEKAKCAWKFTDETSVMVLESDSDKQFQKVIFGWDPTTESSTAVIHDGKSDATDLIRDAKASTGVVDVFVDSQNADDVRNKMTLRRISDIRVTLLFEKRNSAAGSWRRISEIGYTRAGEQLASSRSSGRQCVVTGGLGTMTVMHDGKSYYVCCEGCRQAFESDPEGTIADYRQRLKTPKEK